MSTHKTYDRASMEVEITLENGAVLKGTPEVVASMLKLMNVSAKEDGIHYNSSTSGLIPIKDMDTNHLRNAILKMYTNWVESLRKVDDVLFVNTLTKGAGAGNITLLAMVKELKSRSITFY